VMKDIKMPMAAVGVPSKPMAAEHYDSAHRSRGRAGYGDRD
jgi:hypothetical protein